MRHVDDAAFHLRNAEKSLVKAAELAPDWRSEDAIGNAGRRVKELRLVLEIQVERALR